MRSARLPVTPLVTAGRDEGRLEQPAGLQREKQIDTHEPDIPDHEPVEGPRPSLSLAT